MGMVGSAVRDRWEKLGGEIKRSFLCGMTRLVFAGIDPEAMLICVLFDAGLLRIEKSSVIFLCGSGRTRTESVRLSMKKRWF